MSKKIKIVSCIYAHPELYPPTLNALAALSDSAERIWIVFPNTKETKWHFPANVTPVSCGRFRSPLSFRKASILFKATAFLQYCRKLKALIKAEQPEWVVAYDAIALLALGIALRNVQRKPKLWYHSHDVLEANTVSKYSLGWFAYNNEKKAFRHIDLFTLPSAERLQYFSVNELKGRWLLLPNYPAKKFYQQFNTAQPPDRFIKLIYQGTISDEHGIEEIFDGIKSSGLPVHFTLIGFITESYRKKLTGLISTMGLGDRVSIKPAVDYTVLPFESAQAHIGIAVNIPKKVIYATGATASNKIYEYAAVGLPVIYFDDPHYKEHLEKFRWTFPCNLTAESFNRIVQTIIADYETISSSALHDFETSLNFESAIQPVLDLLNNEKEVLV